jgi:histidyl-tRNA synthetase
MKDKYRKDLKEMIPKLDSEIEELFEECQDPEFLDGDKMNQIEEIIIKLEEKEERFKKADETAEKYNKWQECLETQPTVFEHLEQCREELSLRAEMWKSLNSWKKMED